MFQLVSKNVSAFGAWLHLGMDMENCVIALITCCNAFFCAQVLEVLDLLSTLQCWFISVLFTADIISTVEFNYTGDLLATGDKGGRVVIFQREQEVSD